MEKPENPDKIHFDKMLINELTWKLDREVWAHVPNPEPGEPWSQSKAREETRKLIHEYIGNFDEAKSRIKELEQQNEALKKALIEKTGAPFLKGKYFVNL